MSITVGIFLDTLLAHNNPHTFNQTRLNQLKPYFNNPIYEIFIYTKEVLKKSDQLYIELIEAGLKMKKSPSIHQLIVIPQKKIESQFLKHQHYLKHKADNGDIVIIIGSFTDKQSAWAQNYDFSLVDWPYDSQKTMGQLFAELLSILSDSAAIKTTESFVSEDVKPIFFPIKRLNRRDIPYVPSCAKEIQELLESIRILRDDIKNLTQTNMKLEEEQLILQKQMISSEKTQTLFLEELLTHFPWTLAEIGMTMFMVVMHVIEGCIYIDKCVRKHCFSKTVSEESKVRIEEVKVSVKTQTIPFYSVASTSLETSTGTLASNDKSTPLKNFSKKNRYVPIVSASNEAGYFHKKKGGMRKALLRDEYGESSSKSIESNGGMSYQQIV
ncbi:MAG: hypothetical protein REH83_04595 [Rickettsiella sp.]|nr:hypothetical protein [Rickettsiella sp.]